MRDKPVSRTQMGLRRYLAAGYALLIMYASLSPFNGWQEPSTGFLEVLGTPLDWPHSRFDLIVNLFAYLPFGLLLYLTLPAHISTTKSIVFATLGGMLLSAAMEYAQMYLPSRTSSNLDLLSNTVGGMLGSLLAATVAPRAWFKLLMDWRQRLFHSGNGADFGLALLFLWLLPQVNPSLPMLGNTFIGNAVFVSLTTLRFSWMETVSIMLNLLLLGCLLLTLLRQQHHAVAGLLLVLCTVALAKFVAAVLLLKAQALLLWLNDEAIFGICTGLLLLFVASRLPPKWLSWCAVVASLSYLCLAHVSLSSNKASMSLYQWHYGHLFNYNNLSQVIMLLFPLLLLIYLWRIRNQSDSAV
jgi:VanZ family protein